MSDQNEAVTTIGEGGNNSAVETINPKGRMMPPEPEEQEVKNPVLGSPYPVIR